MTIILPTTFGLSEAMGAPLLAVALHAQQPLWPSTQFPAAYIILVWQCGSLHLGLRSHWSRHLVFSLPEAGQGAAASAQPEQPSAEVQQPQQQSPQSDERSQNSVGLGAGGSLLTPGTLSGDAEALHRARSHSRRGHVAVPLKLVYWRPPRTRTAPSVMQEFKMQLKAFGMRPVDVWAVDGKYYVCGQKCMRLEAISAHPNVKEVMCRVLEGPPPHMQPMLGTHYECFLDTVSRGLRKRATHKGAPKSKDASTAPPSVVVPDGKKGKAIPLGSFKDQLQSLKLSS
eukprot:jgi/Mesvir1/10465/Mv06720-RA.1